MDIWTTGATPPQQVVDHLAGVVADGARAVCFDYFDTLVTRTVSPEYTKELAAELLSIASGRLIEGPELYGLRRNLEAVCCRQRAAAGGELEFYLDSFAPRYLQVLRDRLPEFLAGWSEDRFTALLLDIELGVEKRVQAPLEEAVGVVRQLKDRGVQTVLISDFYLPSSHYLPMLQHLGLRDLFDHVFISADHELAKGSGRLYGKVCDELGCRPDELLMVGDNRHADIEMAAQQGLRALFVDNPRQRRLYQDWTPDTVDAAAEFDRSLSSLDSATPFPEMTHSLWLFTHRLFARLAGDRVEHAFFFSKEGEFLKRLFDRYQQELFGRPLITGHYLLASRKATFLASLRPLADEDFSRLFNHYRDISCRDFLLSLNLEESLAADICAAAGLDFTTRVSDFPARAEFAALRESARFQEVYEERRIQQRENFIAYLDSFGVDYHEDGLSIVDVGWKGSIQDNIFHIFDGEVEVRGFYVGSLIASERRRNNVKQGVLFDDHPRLSPYFHVYNNNRSLYEMVLGASHGSADGYYTQEQFDRLPDDHSKVAAPSLTGSAGDIRVATLDLPEERELFETTIRPLQEALFSCFSADVDAFVRACCRIPDDEWFARRHARMVFTPTRGEIDFFERLYHLENFGIFEYTSFQVGERLSLSRRLKNLVSVVKSKTLLESGVWPPIILRRLGVGFYRHIDGYRRYRRVFKQAGS